MFCKIERCDRRAKREQVVKLADKFTVAVENELEREPCNNAIIVAQEKIKTL